MDIPPIEIQSKPGCDHRNSDGSPAVILSSATSEPQGNANYFRFGLKCSKCGADIRPSRDEKPPKAAKGERERVTKLVRVLGDPYRWVKFNRRPRNVRCMAKGCAFRRSDLTTSDKLGRVYDAQDAASDASEREPLAHGDTRERPNDRCRWSSGR